jgi:arylsulfatase A-like enzyme
VRRPNILLIHTDQQRWDALGANGNAEIHTPNLDALAASGVNLDHYLVQNPVCMPSRMCLLTGQYPAAFGALRNGVPLPLDAVTLPRLLSPYGYRTANIGKLHFLPHACRDHRRPHPSYGFDHVEISDEPGDYEDAYRAWIRRIAPEELDRACVGLSPAAGKWQQMMNIDDGIPHPERGENRPRPWPARSDVTHAAFVADQTIEYLRTHGDRPFLCVAGFYAPHAPWVVPQEFLDLYDPDALGVPQYPPELQDRRGEAFSDEALRAARHGYYGAVTEVDHHVGRMLGALEEMGLADDTVVIFTADHGEWLGDHLRFAKGYPAHDPVSRVPFVVRWPAGGVAGGRTVSGLAESVDVVPTLLGWAGIQPPPHLRGRPLAVGEAAEGRPSALTEGVGWKTLRMPDWRYVLHADGKELLFDLRAAFGEYRDVAGEPDAAGTLAEHRRELARRLVERDLEGERVAPY